MQFMKSQPRGSNSSRTDPSYQTGQLINIMKTHPFNEQMKVYKENAKQIISCMGQKEQDKKNLKYITYKAVTCKLPRSKLGNVKKSKTYNSLTFSKHPHLK